MIELNAADRVHRIEDAYTNWFVVEEDRRLTIVDCGLPRSWRSLQELLARLGRRAQDIEAIVLTHAHFDHVGFAERARTTFKVPVYVHQEDVALTKHPLRYDHERPRSLYLATQPRALPIVAALTRDRAWWPSPIEEVVPFGDGSLPVPGSPRVLYTPGHTHGHCSLHFPDRDALIAGDALVTLDPYTGKRGPRLVARAATADVETNLASLDALANAEATILLTGHGEPWRGGSRSAVEAARQAGAS
jgi:glyoxylase-like metal-dependent hydrolase (beta-lactamase superfamily II)